MYYQSTELPITPSVAFRALHDQLRIYLDRFTVAPGFDMYLHFDGPITPPRPGTVRDDSAVTGAITEYISKHAARSAALAAGEIALHGRLTRAMFVMEHSVAIDLGRNYPNELLREREVHARRSLAVAAFWYSQSDLGGIGVSGSHPVLGLRPVDQLGRSLYDFAAAAFRPPLGPLTGTFEINLVEPEIDLRGSISTYS